MATKKPALSRALYGSKASELKRDRREQKRGATMNEETLSMAHGGAVKKGAKSPAIALIIGVAKPKGKTTMMSKGSMAKGKK